MINISIAKGENRKQNIAKALSLIDKEICDSIKRKNPEQLFIKINAIDINFPLACTHPDALEAALNYFSKFNFNEIIVGDNTFAFSKEGTNPYTKLSAKFKNIRFSDLTDFPKKQITLETIYGEKTAMISFLPKMAFTVSLTIPKTHDTFVYTGAGKNMVGCVLTGRSYIHGLPFLKRIFLNLVVESNRFNCNNLIKVVATALPDLAILDAFEAMEGNGPMFGTAVPMHIAMASTDCIALDLFTAKITGLSDAPYLKKFSNCEDKINNTTLIKHGFSELADISKDFKKHYLFKYQTSNRWKFYYAPFDFVFPISIIKRWYRLRDKIVEKLKN